MSQPTPAFEFPTPSAEPVASAAPATPVDPTPVDQTPADPFNGAPASTDPSTDVSWEDFVAKHTEGKEYPQPAVEQAPAADPGLAAGQEALAAGTDAPSQTDTQQQLAALSHQLGMDLRGFSNVNDAVAAAQLAIAQQAIAPPPQAPAHYQQVEQQAPPAEEQSSFPLDLENIHDEALAKNLKAVKEQFDAMAKQVNALEQQRQTDAAARRQRNQELLDARANTVVDQLKSEKYGSARGRTPVQQIAYNNLMGTATQLIQQYAAVGQMPVIEEVMQRALILSGDLQVSQLGQSVQQPPANSVPAPAPAAQPRSLPTIPQSPAGTKFGPNDFDKDPNFLRALRHVR